MPKRSPGAADGPSQRQRRVAEEVRHALAAVLSRGDFRDPDLAGAHVTVTEVRASPDLKHMTAFVSGLGRPVPGAQFRALRRAAPFLRGQIAKAVRLKFAPDFHRCIRFQVKHIHLTRSAEQIEQDDRFDLSRSAGCRCVRRTAAR